MSKECSKCKNQVPGDSNFCLNCGYSFSGNELPEMAELRKRVEVFEKEKAILEFENKELKEKHKRFEAEIEILKRKIELSQFARGNKRKSFKMPKINLTLSSLVKKRLLISLAGLLIIAAIFIILPSKVEIVEIRYHNGVYKGEVKIENNDTIRHGKGTFVFNENSINLEGVVLKGIWVDDVRQGAFTAMKNGKTYKGELGGDKGGNLTASGDTIKISRYEK